MATLTERHAALSRAAAVNPKSWNVASNGAGARRWLVLSQTDTPWPEYHKDKQGNLIRYTEAGALAKAEQLNKEKTATLPKPIEPVPERPTLKEEAERLLDYWERHGDNPETVAKWAITDMLGILRYIVEED